MYLYFDWSTMTKSLMPIWMIVIWAIIWLLTALWRWWNKWIEVHRAYATLITGLVMVLWSLLVIFILKVPINLNVLKTNFRYILIPALSIVLVRPLVIIGFQKWYSVSQFSLIFSIFALLFTVLLWVLFYKETLSIKQIIGIILSIITIYLLK